jgi:hypothetical protein
MWLLSPQECLWIFGETYAFVCATVNINGGYGNSFLGKFEHVFFFQETLQLSFDLKVLRDLCVYKIVINFCSVRFGCLLC